MLESQQNGKLLPNFVHRLCVRVQAAAAGAVSEKKVYASELLTEYRSHRNFSEKRKRKILLYFCLGGCINTCICSWCVIKL